MQMQTQPQTLRLLGEYVKRQVRQRTNGLIRSLTVEVLPGRIVLEGQASSYYAKQLATHAALDVFEEPELALGKKDTELTNNIEVS